MANIKNHLSNEEQQIIKEVINNNQPKRNLLLNSLKAFLIGGLISIIGQGLLELYQNIFKLENKVASSLLSITIVFITSILTGFGIFDKIGQFAGAGTIVPITGFANSMTSSAIESKSEGLIMGIMMNMFKLAGAVIVAGVCSAFISGLLIYIIGGLG